MRTILENGSLFCQGTFHDLTRLVIEKDKIAEVTIAGGKVKKPKAGGKGKGEEEVVINCEGKVILPGFIDAHTHVTLEEEGVGWMDADLNESFGLATPQVRAMDALKMRDQGLRDALRGGVTTCMVTPGSANPIGGQACIIKMRGQTAEEAVVRENAGMKFAFGENPKRVYGEQKQMPSTRMGTAAVVREWLMKAQDYSKKKKAKDFKERDIKLEAMLPLLEGKVPVRAHAHLADDIITAYRIGQEFDLEVIIEHCTEGHLIAKELGRWKAKAVVGPTMASRSKSELRNLSYDTVKILLDEGCIVAVTTDHPVIPVYALGVCAGMCVRHGLEEDRAIKTVTEYPAAILGLDKRLGKLEVGYDADVVIWSGHPFDTRSCVEHVFIDGREVTL